MLYALKYSIKNRDIDKDRVIRGVDANIDGMTNSELKEYIEIIDTNQAIETGDSKFTWLDLKKALEKELYVRNTAEIILTKLNRPIPREWR